MPLARIEISGNQGIDKTALLAASGITAKSSYASIDTAALSARLRAFPGVYQATVEKEFPDSLRIFIKPQIIVGSMLQNTLDKKTRMCYITDRGELVNEAPAQSLASFPVITGIETERVQGSPKASKIPERYTKLLGNLAVIAKDAPAALSAISEIRVAPATGTDNLALPDGPYSLIVYPRYGKVRVRLGETLSVEKLQYALLLLDALTKSGIETDEVDFRTGTAVYTTKTPQAQRDESVKEGTDGQ
jgi:hypothetical protein